MNVTLYGKNGDGEVFEDVIKDFEIDELFWIIWLCPKCSHMYSYKRKGDFSCIAKKSYAKMKQIWRFWFWRLGISITYESSMIIIYLSFLNSVKFCFVILKIVIGKYSNRILIYSYCIIPVIIKISLWYVSFLSSNICLQVSFWC